MRIEVIPCLQDNYAYLVIDEATKTCAIVDPSEANPVEIALAETGTTPVALWLTHHHWDHVGGVEALVEAYPDLKVYGSRYDMEAGRIPKQTDALGEGDSFEFAGEKVRILEIPGHTLGAIAFILDGNAFTGDTLFIGGCGRVFEGTMELMTESMNKLRKLPGDTRIWCGHEYTVKNLDFARTVDPTNDAITDRLRWATELRGLDKPTVPGTLQDELATNPFLRFDQPSIAQGRGPAEAFGAIRKAKDAF